MDLLILEYVLKRSELKNKCIQCSKYIKRRIFFMIIPKRNEKKKMEQDSFQFNKNLKNNFIFIFLAFQFEKFFFFSKFGNFVILLFYDIFEMNL